MAVFKLFDLIVLVPATILVFIFHVRVNLPSKCLLGLSQYIPTAGPGGAAAKGKKRGGKGAAKQEANLGEAESIFDAPVTQLDLFSSVFNSVLDNLIFGIQLAVVICPAYAAAYVLREQGVSELYATPTLLAIGLALSALLSLAKIEPLSPYSTRDDSAFFVVFTLVGFFAAAALFALNLDSSFAWSANDASTAIGSLLERLMQRTAAQLNIPEVAVIAAPTPVWISTALTSLAAVITGLLLGPAMRFVRAYRLQLDPPGWAKDQIVVSALGRARLHLQLAAPAVAALLWVNPIFGAAALGLTERQAAGVRAAAAVFAGVVMLLNGRVLVQRYLDRALVMWHTQKHMPRKNSSEREAAAAVIRTTAGVVRKFVCKAAIQFLAPGAFFLGCGLALGGFVALPTHGAAAATAADAAKVVNCVVGFCVWWAGATWFVLCAAGSWLQSSGTLLA